MHVGYGSIIQERKKKKGKVIFGHLLLELTAISAQLKSPGVKKSFLSHKYDWIQNNKLIYTGYNWDTWKN